MQILNKDKKDFAPEYILQLGVMLEAVWAAEIIGYRVANTMDAAGFKNTLFQQKKQALNKARVGLQTVISNLEIAFDTTFDKIFNAENQVGARSGYVQKLANDIVQLLLIYYARGDGDTTRRDNMKKALLNFKPVSDIDINEIMKYYDFKI